MCKGSKVMAGCVAHARTTPTDGYLLEQRAARSPAAKALRRVCRLMRLAEHAARDFITAHPAACPCGLCDISARRAVMSQTNASLAAFAFMADRTREYIGCDIPPFLDDVIRPNG